MFSGGARALATTGHGMCPHSFYLGGGLPDSDGVGEYVLLSLRGGCTGGSDENTPVVDNVLRPNPEACHIRYLLPYTDCTCVMLAFAATVNGFMSVTIG